MVEQLMVIEKNCTTGEEVIRPMTADELADRQKNIDDFNAREVIRVAEEAEKAEIKASALAKFAELGLTEDEVKAIAG
jgi:hypothetical protein